MTEKTVPSKPFHFEFLPRAAPEAVALAQALGEEVAAEFGPRDEESFALVVRDGDTVLGGVNGLIHWRWLYVAQFYVEPHARAKNVGAALLARTEDFARQKACAGIYLDTFSPRARRFYECNGFKRAGEIANFPPGAARAFLYKPLKSG